MGLKADYQAYLDGLTDNEVLPPEPTPPDNTPPVDMSTIMPLVTQRFREGVGDWDIAVEFQLEPAHVAIGREIWQAEVTERSEPDPVI